LIVFCDGLRPSVIKSNWLLTNSTYLELVEILIETNITMHP